MSEGRRFDPFAAAVLGAAALCGVALAAWVAVGIWRSGSLSPAEKPAPVATPAPAQTPAPAPTPAPSKPGAAPQRGLALPADRTWTYAVRLEPATWRDAVLVYRTVRESSGLAVQAEFRHSKGQMAFRLGNYAAGHPSHAQVRFPGFFMHGAYLDWPLEKGRRMEWTYPWQAADNRVRAGRVRRWRAVVGDTEKVSVPAGRFDAVRVDATLTYEDAGNVAATVSETLWIARSPVQIVKVVRSGRSPDEAAERIVADLADVR